jgi:hypothetical protein
MARTIDQKLGRAALVDTLDIGPLSFVDVYNKLVPEEEQILVFAGTFSQKTV